MSNDLSRRKFLIMASSLVTVAATVAASDGDAASLLKPDEIAGKRVLLMESATPEDRYIILMDQARTYLKNKYGVLLQPALSIAARYTPEAVNQYIDQYLEDAISIIPSRPGCPKCACENIARVAKIESLATIAREAPIEAIIDAASGIGAGASRVTFVATLCNISEAVAAAAISGVSGPALAKLLCEDVC